MHWWNGGWNMGFMGFWWVAALALMVALVWFVARGGLGGRREDSAEEILKRRFARGEIDRDEYQRRLAELRH